MGPRLPWLLVLLSFPTAGCREPNDVKPLDDGCRSCHGSNRGPAPPKALDGSTDPSSIGVGAHDAHLFGARLMRPVSCTECHVRPEQIDDPGHLDDDDPPQAELTWGPLASTAGAEPEWRRDELTCASTYCHGGTMSGGSVRAPLWNVTDGSQVQCDSCHAMPPPAPHPANDDCHICHESVAGPNQTIIAPQRHIDGKLDVLDKEGCVGCHGTEANLAPPVDARGNAATDLRSVGAHQAHLAGGQHSAAVACEKCHLVPAKIDDPGHLDTDFPAEVMFEGEWSPDTAKCTNTYCHGATSSGGTLTDPTWTVVDGSQSGCGTCHGLPPAAPHPENDRCAICHAPTAGPDLTIANRATHADGKVQVSDGTCIDCHGSGDSSAPPTDSMQRSDLGLPTIGAHRAHLESATGLSRPIACNECHLVPQKSDDPGHIDAPPAELTFGALASRGGAPMYDPATNTCSNTYCHGATLPDGVLNTPTWTVLDGSQSACGTCHGNPPAGDHPNDDRCELCHLPTAGPEMTIAGANTHIDGVLQVAASCDSCHGQNGVSAPPIDLDGASDLSLPTVGAHQTHLSGGRTGKPVECTQCHTVPLDVGDPGHLDTERPAELVFGSIAAFGSTPIYSRPTCADTYCHSGVSASVPNPTWNITDGTQAECGGCHGTPPETPAHRNLAADCSTCHLPTAGPNLTIANRATHVDGVLQVTGLDCTACHGDMTSSAPPIDLAGALEATDPEVGAHRAHLSGGAFSAAVACSSCHLVPADSNDPGHLDTAAPAEVTFSGRAAGSFATPVFDQTARSCGNTYCHQAAEPIWNEPGTAECGSCHGLPPPEPHPQVTNCEACHATAGPNLTIADRTRHVDGTVDVDDALLCQACHGSATNAAPPFDLDGLTTSPAVGAHQAHLAGTGRSLQVACTECHLDVDPSTPNQAGHYDTPRPAEVIFGVLARTAGANPTRSGATCSNTYCHGATLLGGATTNPGWGDGEQSCGSCHGMPPPDSTHGDGTATQCESCHPDTAGPNQTIVGASSHVNGVIDTSATCDACHGMNGDPAPPRDLAGLLTSDKVGAHQAHLNPSASRPVDCSVCHLVPNTYGDAGHADTPAPAEVRITGYTAARLECSNNYCHGNNRTVVWNDADGSESVCGSCHAMPPPTPAHNGQGPNGCQNCHQESAGPNQTIIAPALHVDDVVQVSGGGCDTCHGSPPAPGRESYAGSAGAHAQHAGTLGFECAVCHGNNGSGPEHDQGNGTVVRSNVNIVFNASLSFPGGTTMGNATYNRNAQTCAVGCHNPRVGNPPEAQNLNNTLAWTAGAPSCRGCHDQVQASAPRSHDIAALGDNGCLTCHDQNGHTTGAMVIRDPDPNDAFSWSATNLDGLCKSCHDGGGGTSFGNRTAPNVSAFWTTSSHGAEGFRCSECHTYHASTNGPLFIDASSQTCMRSGCHSDLAPQFGQVPNGPISHHRIEGGNGIQLACINCHNPHLAQPVPLTTIDPDNKYTLMSIPASARTNRRSAGDYRAFCLRCHDGTPPPGVQGALNIATALAGGTEPTGFKKENESLHRKEHSGYNCQNCHASHGSSGTAGINRGRLLYNYMNVRAFPYTGEGSCGTSPNGTNFSCH